jgi:hypothetical protein
MRQLIISIWNKEELPEEWKESIIGPIYKNGDTQIVVITEPYHFGQHVRNVIQHVVSRLTAFAEEIIGDH